MQNSSSPEMVQKISAFLRENPQTMTIMVAHQFGVPELEIVRLLPDGRARELDPARAVQLIEAFAALGPLYVIVSSGTVILEAHGVFGGFSKTGPFFNVQTDTLDMHIRHKDLSAIFAVQKPSHMTALGTLSFQFFNPSGNSAMKVFLNFGAADPTPEQAAHFDRLVQEFKV
jgi:putative hemin transport protein